MNKGLTALEQHEGVIVIIHFHTVTSLPMTMSTEVLGYATVY